MLEDAVKQGMLISSGGECRLLKFYYTDGFGWYFDGQRITFILHECKTDQKFVGNTIRSYSTCLRKALLQNIGYYFKIKHGKFSTFSKNLVALAHEFGYDDTVQFIIDHFGMFLITTPKFVCAVTVNEIIRNLLGVIEPYIVNAEQDGLSPSKYWENVPLRSIMENLSVDDFTFQMMPDKVDLADTGEILNNILKSNNNGINN